MRFALDLTRHLIVPIYRIDGQWLMYGATPARTQFHEGISLRPPFRTVSDQVPRNAPRVSRRHRRRCCLPHQLPRQALRAVDDRRPHTVGARPEHREEASSPAVVGSRLVVHAMASGRVVVLDRASGRVLWSRQTSARIESSPAVVDGIDYLGNWAGDIYALDLQHAAAALGLPRRLQDHRQRRRSRAARLRRDYCGRVLALAARTGSCSGAASAGSPIYGSSALAGGGSSCLRGEQGRSTPSRRAGSYLWHVPTGGLVYSGPAVWNGRVYFGSYTGTLYCVSAATGAVLWTRYAGGQISGSPTVIDGVVYVGSFGHRILGVDGRTGPSRCSTSRTASTSPSPATAAGCSLRLGDHLGGRAESLSKNNDRPGTRASCQCGRALCNDARR